ncbi:MAG: amidohydrolase family protein, partial [Bauldia litoralis]
MPGLAVLKQSSRAGARIFAALLAVSAVAAPAAAQQSTAFVGATLIDGRGGAPVPNAVVVIAGDKIVAAGPAASVKVPSGARVVQLAGKTILPGLIDTHMHIGGSGGGSVNPKEFTPLAAANNFKAYLKSGVTTVFDMAGNPFIDFQKAALTSGKAVGPRLFGVKYAVTRPGSHPLGLLEEYKLMKLLGPVYPQVTTIKQAKAAVAKSAADKTDGLKIMHTRSEFPGTMRYDSDKEKLSPEILKTLVTEAHAKGLRVFAHIAWPSEAKEVVEAGVDALAHNISMAETGAVEVYRLMAARGTVLIPTLAQA